MGCDGVYKADRNLVTRMRTGEQRAFDEFFAMCSTRLAAYAARRSGLNSYSVEDVVQNTLIKAIRNLNSYRGEAALLTWVTEICRHELADFHRKEARRPTHESLDTTETASTAVRQISVPEQMEPPGEWDSMMRRTAVMRAFEALPKQYAVALEAKYGDGLSVEDIAQLLEVTPIAAQSLLARARQAFREQWRLQQEESGSGARGSLATGSHTIAGDSQ
jgi:RNA polymerase sigma-70 factor (ECF subfamily)